MGTRAVVVVMALLIGACGGAEQPEPPQPQEQQVDVTTWQVNKDGSMNKGSVRTETMPWSRFTAIRQALAVPAQSRSEIEVSMAALLTGVSYGWNCTGDTTIWGAEVKAFKTAYESGECRGWGAGNNDVMGVGLDHWDLFRWNDNSSLYHNVRYFRHKAYDYPVNVVRRRAAFHVNAQGGGGCVACFESLTSGQDVTVNDVTKATGSFVIARFF
jgi:hypothetical protein